MPTGIYDRTKSKPNSGIFKKDHISWMKNLRGIHLSSKTEFKKGNIPYYKLHPELAPKGKNHPMYDKHHSEKSKTKMCKSHKGKKHSEKTKRLLSKIRIGRRRPKVSEMFKGHKNPQWRGGISRKPYGFDFNEELKELIRKRDQYKCQECRAPQEEFTKKLPVHHIDYDKENNNPKNLITLCFSCNSKANANRDYWKDYFIKMNI